MKRILFIVLGSLLFGVAAFLVGTLISQYQVRVLLMGPDEAGEFIDVFLLLWPLFFIFGGVAGNIIYRKSIRIQ